MPSAFLNLFIRSHWQQWGILLLLSLLFLSLLELAKIPAALMLGPMIAGIFVGCMHGTIAIKAPVFKGAQTIVGCMIAASISPQVIEIFLHDWWLFSLIILSAIFVSSLLGILLTKFRIIPGATAIWGSSPGAASTMVIMAEDFGADIRMVAFMQYLRVLLTAFTASLVAALVMPENIDGAIQSSMSIKWFPPIDVPAFASTIILAAVGAIITYRFSIPAGYILLPLFIGTFLRSMGWIELQLPEWLLAMSYALLGWRIGLSFDVGSLRNAYKVFPYVLGSTLLLMFFCALLAWVLVMTYGVDPLTAFLATSPGGLDTVAVISASRPDTDMSFVMTLQVARLLLLNIICPPLAKFLTKYANQHYAE